MESIRAKSSTGKQSKPTYVSRIGSFDTYDTFCLGLPSSTDQPWSKVANRDHMTYSQVVSACLATQGHTSSTITQVHNIHWVNS